MKEGDTIEKIKMPDNILEKSYAKYKDKKGRKAINLKMRIDCMKAFNELMERVS